MVHSLALLGFFVITFLIHTPYFLKGEHIYQHDILQGTGGNKQLIDYRNETGEESLWMNTMFSGMPAYLNGVRYSGDLLIYPYKLLTINLGHPVGITFVSFVSFYILLLVFRVRPWIAFAGAIAFALNGFNIISIVAGHNAKIAAVSLMPLVLAGIHLAFNGKKWMGFGLTALSLGLQIRTGHPQITYYLLLIVIVYGIHTLIKYSKAGQLKEFGLISVSLIIAAVLAVGSNYGKLKTTLEYSKYSIRGKSELRVESQASSGLDYEYAFRFSNGLFEPLFLFVPNIFGGSSQQELSDRSEVAKVLRQGGYNRSQIAQQIKTVPTYWGEQPLTAPYYAGTITVLLFILGIVFLPMKEKAWLITLAFIGIMLSWGKNFSALNDLLFHFMPGYNKFRSVTFIIIITIFAINLLGFLALERLVSSDWTKEVKKKCLITFAIGGGFLAVLFVSSGVPDYRGPIDANFPDWYTDALREDRKSILQKDTLRALFFIAVTGVIIWLERMGKFKIQVALAAIAFFVFVDNFMLSKRFLNEENFRTDPGQTYFMPTEADNAILSTSKAGERVLNLENPFNEARTSYFHESIGGYHGAKIRRYQDLIDRCISLEIQAAVTTLRSQSLNFSDLSVLNMLNAKFFYAGADRSRVFQNGYSNGNGWIVSNVVRVNSPDEEIAALCGLDTKTEAVIDTSSFDVDDHTGSGSINLVERTPNKVVYKASVSGNSALGVFSEIYYKDGWVASIDENPTDMLRANYVLRALEIPEGDHEIVFEFKSGTYETGNTIMWITSLLIFILFTGCTVLQIKESKK